MVDKEGRETPEQEGTHILEETRMVLPGVQALFGFQLIAFFTETFRAAPTWFRIAHLGATGLTVLAIILLLAPAAYHRQAEPHVFSKYFIRIGTVFLTAGMFTLALGMSLEFFLIAWQAFSGRVTGAILAGGLLVVFVAVWYVFPMVLKARNGRRGERA